MDIERAAQSRAERLFLQSRTNKRAGEEAERARRAQPATVGDIEDAADKIVAAISRQTRILCTIHDDNRRREAA